MNEEQAYEVSLQVEPRAKVKQYNIIIPKCHSDNMKQDSRVEEEEGEIEVDGHRARAYGGDIEVISKEAWANPSASVRAGDSNS